MIKQYKIVLGVEYNGTNYFGWQKQINIKSIQMYLEKSISKIANEKIYIKCGGRTDKKVHAIEQVIHFITNTYRSNKIWVKGINHFLPKDIIILWAIKINKKFHSSLSAISREYVYIINTIPSTFLNNISTYYPEKINIKKITKAAKYLIGTHNFTSFRSSGCQAKTAYRKIIHIKIKKIKSFYLFYIKANAFLYHMVRNIIGNLLKINKYLSYKWIKNFLLSKSRRLSAPPAPPQGLYLLKINYPKIYYLPKNKNILFNIYNIIKNNNI